MAKGSKESGSEVKLTESQEKALEKEGYKPEDIKEFTDLMKEVHEKAREENSEEEEQG